MKVNDPKDLAILILTCDKYRDLWNPFLTLFDRYWHSPKHNVYFCSDTIKVDWANKIPLVAGKLVSWSERLKLAIAQIPEKYVLLLLDDYFLMSKVNETKIELYQQYMEQNNAAYLRIYPLPLPDEAVEFTNEIGLILAGSQYRTSTQAAIWDRKVLFDFIDINESIWDFETIGSNRSISIQKPFYGVYDQPNNLAINYFCTAVNSGVWAYEILALDKKESLNIDFTKRKLESILDYSIRYTYLRVPIWMRHMIDFLRYRFKRL